ncbi:MAG: PAS domain S-box protein, partial [Deltaproteobacteria bacterium]
MAKKGGIMDNSSKRKQVEDFLNKDEKICRAIAEAAQDAIYIINHEGEIEYVNSFGATLFGFQPEKVVGRQLEAMFPPYIAGHLKEKLGKVFETGLPLSVEDNIPFLKGKVWMHTLLAPIRNEAGEVESVIGISRDITGRKRLEEELRLLQELMQEISLSNDFTSAMEVALRKICEDTGWVMGEVWVPSQDGSYLECSPAWYGVSRELKKFREASEGFKFRPGIGLPGSVWLLKKAAWETDIALDSNFLRAPYAVEAGLRAAMAIPVLSGDKVVAVLDFFVPEVKEEDKRLIGLVSTVAAYLGILFQRKQAEEELRKLSYVVEHSPASIFITNAKGNIEYVNPKFIEMTGYSREEVVGKKPDILTLGEAILSDKEWRGGFLNTKKTGEQFWEYSTVSPVRNGKGEIIHFIGVSEDITDRQKLEEQLLHSQKLEAIGRLVGGIAHDFNNILTGIIGFAGIMQMSLKKDDPFKEHVEQILEAAGRGASLTQSLLVFGRKQIIHLAPVSLNEIIGKVNKLLSRLIGEDIELRATVSKKDLMIMADSVQIEQILMNLATNARDAMPDGGVLAIETGREKLDKEFVKMHGYGEAGDYAIISVSDTGMGMDEKTRERIFEPFFTT